MVTDESLLQFVQDYAKISQQQTQATIKIQKQVEAIYNSRLESAEQMQKKRDTERTTRKRKDRNEKRKGGSLRRKKILDFLAGKKRDKKEESGLMKFIKKALLIGGVVAGGALLYKNNKNTIDKGLATLRDKVAEWVPKVFEGIVFVGRATGELIIKGFKWALDAAAPHIQEWSKKLVDLALEGLKWALDYGLEKMDEWASKAITNFLVDPLKKWVNDAWMSTGIPQLGQKVQGDLNRAIHGNTDFATATANINSQLKSAGLNQQGRSLDANRRGRGSSLTDDQKEAKKLAEAKRARLAQLRKEMDKEIAKIPKTGGTSRNPSYTSTEKQKIQKIREKYGTMALEVSLSDTVKLQTGGQVSQSDSGSARGGIPPTPSTAPPAPVDNKSGKDALMSAAKKSKGLMRGQREQCANSTRAVLAAAGHPAANKTTKKGDLDPEGLKYNGRGFAASFAGSDMGTVKTNISQLKPGDIMLWRDTYGNFAPGAITHVGMAGPGNTQFDHGTSTGWRQRSRSSLANKFAYGIDLNGTASGANIQTAAGSVATGLVNPLGSLVTPATSLLNGISASGAPGGIFDMLGPIGAFLKSLFGGMGDLFRSLFSGGSNKVGTATAPPSTDVFQRQKGGVVGSPTPKSRRYQMGGVVTDAPVKRYQMGGVVKGGASAARQRFDNAQASFGSRVGAKHSRPVVRVVRRPPQIVSAGGKENNTISAVQMSAPGDGLNSVDLQDRMYRLQSGSGY